MGYAMNVMQQIKEQVEANNTILYMKGTPQFPQCGFSSRVVQILANLNVQFAHINVLEEPDIRANLPKYANWPTFPQLYHKGELVGGCDIISEMFESGELTKLLV